ncbi:AP-2 complex subunit alpha-1-like, partial [Olea europaea subsp. europaea]
MFVGNIWNCQNEEQEQLRLNKEIDNIRTRFKNGKANCKTQTFARICIWASIWLC